MVRTHAWTFGTENTDAEKQVHRRKACCDALQLQLRQKGKRTDSTYGNAALGTLIEQKHHLSPQRGILAPWREKKKPFSVETHANLPQEIAPKPCRIGFKSLPTPKTCPHWGVDV